MSFEFFNNDPNRKGNTNAKKYSPEKTKEDQISMWIADTDFYSPKEITEALIKKASVGHFGYEYNTYEFEKAVANWIKKRFNYEINPNWVSYSTGVINGIAFAVHALTSSKDRILIQTPVYQNFKKTIELNGRELIKNPLVLKNGRFEIDFEDLETKLKDEKVTMMILCNPHNPSGRCFTRKELEKIGNLCTSNNVLIVSDEIHQDIIYPGHKHINISSISMEIANNCITFINPSKTFNIAGLFTAAWFTQNKEIFKKMNEKQIAHKAICRNVFGEVALITAYNECDYYADEMMAYLTETREIVKKYVDDHLEGVSLIWPEATYLYLLDFTNVGFDTQEQLVNFIENEAKLYLNSGTLYGEEGKMLMRINVGVPHKTIYEALERLNKALIRLK